MFILNFIPLLIWSLLFPLLVLADKWVLKQEVDQRTPKGKLQQQLFYLAFILIWLYIGVKCTELQLKTNH